MALTDPFVDKTQMLLYFGRMSDTTSHAVRLV
jgi:hypothetical protein